MNTKQESPSFTDRIKTMNSMYKLNIATSPSLPKDTADRLRKFKKTLMDEVNEIDDIIAMVEEGSVAETEDDHRANVITAIADVLCDVNVFCRSESMKYGIPHEEVLDIIMDSNESKLADDGIPVYDENGKFQKDLKNYWKPEPMIKNLLTCTGPIKEGNW